MSKKNDYSKGDKVWAEPFGEGEITLVASANGEDGPYSVYHVAFANGETRHFTEEQLQAA